MSDRFRRSQTGPRPVAVPRARRLDSKGWTEQTQARCGEASMLCPSLAGAGQSMVQAAASLH